jgi:hypothetical protein
VCSVLDETQDAALTTVIVHHFPRYRSIEHHRHTACDASTIRFATSLASSRPPSSATGRNLRVVDGVEDERTSDKASGRVSSESLRRNEVNECHGCTGNHSTTSYESSSRALLRLPLSARTEQKAVMSCSECGNFVLSGHGQKTFICRNYSDVMTVDDSASMFVDKHDVCQ